MPDDAEIPCPDMPADGAARYRVMVAETQRMQREVTAAKADAARFAEDAVTLAAKLRDMTARAETARAEGMRRAAEIADRRCVLPGDCEHLGPTNSETGVRECALEMRDGICPCWERADEAEKVRDTIRATAGEA